MGAKSSDPEEKGKQLAIRMRIMDQR